MKKIFITGTDTDCGKTYVTCQLLHFFQQQAINAYGIKPIMTGFDPDTLNPMSDTSIISASNPHQKFKVTPWCFKSPVSPHIASALEYKNISTEEMVAFASHQDFNNLDILIIEGAGGLMVPLNDHETWIDFIQKLSCLTILVIGLKLGCLNHALLTVEVLKQFKLPVLGYIVNCLDPHMLAVDDNIKTLQSRLSLPCLGLIPFKGRLIPSEKLRMIVAS